MGKLILTVFALVVLSTSQAQVIKPIPLYPHGIPNSKPTPATYIETTVDGHISKVSTPTITPFFADKGKANGTAVIICLGGGYVVLPGGTEGYDIAKAFNKIGVTAFILKYRLPSDEIMVNKSIGPLQDAQTAIMLVRKNAAQWGINPKKIGIVGFSAGGHLAATAGTHYKKPVINNQGISVRPDFMVLAYPVITLAKGITHQGSIFNLLGTSLTQQNIDYFSNELQVTADTPPTFLMHASDDTAVPVENSKLFYRALQKNKVKAELHLFKTGGHGFGLINPKSKEHWFTWCTHWLAANGFTK
jgi:acetyl esterase/lipase